jgi:hypothetical protein
MDREFQKSFNEVQGTPSICRKFSNINIPLRIISITEHMLIESRM